MCVEGSFLQDWRVFSFGLVSLTFWSAAAAVVFPLLSSLPSSLTHLYLSSISSSSLSLGIHHERGEGARQERGEERGKKVRTRAKTSLSSSPLGYWFLSLFPSSSFLL